MAEVNHGEEFPSAHSVADHAPFFSIVVEPSGAAPIEMTGERDLAAQDAELDQLYAI